MFCLMDVSGSMRAQNKLPLLKKAFRLLVGELDERDRVAIVTYASQSKIHLRSTSCDNKGVIGRAIDSLSEGVHGRSKTQHGLSRAVGRGLVNVSTQSYLTAAVMNLKKLARTQDIKGGLLEVI